MSLSAGSGQATIHFKHLDFGPRSRNDPSVKIRHRSCVAWMSSVSCPYLSERGRSGSHTCDTLVLDFNNDHILVPARGRIRKGLEIRPL